MYNVLLVDDEIEILKDSSKIVTELGFKCYTAQNGKDAINLVKQKRPDIVFTDIKMPNRDGFDVLKTTKEVDHNIPVILFTGYGTIETAVQAMKMGAFDYILKPVSPELMEVTINKAIDYRRLKAENIALKTQIEETYQLDKVVYKSKAMMEAIQRVLKVAKTDASVLLYGESGTGKELIARTIHFNSHRKDKSFIPLDCAALPATLLESEIFGYEKGAFTGAVNSKPGMFELADEGTLFFDEITELEPNLQVKLLRVLQERQIRRLGGLKIKNVDVRIISATNRNPEQALEEKIFREDLYYRLNVVPILMPPLRERKEDIPLLVHYIIKKFNPSYPREIKGISNEAIKSLMRYDWPGNVRQLQNTIEQAMSLTDQDIIDLDDLPENIIKDKIIDLSEEESFLNITFKQAKEKCLNQFYKRYFNGLLKKYNGNISEVARQAGISRRTIYRLYKFKNNK